MRKTFALLMAILALPVCGFGHGAIYNMPKERIEIEDSLNKEMGMKSRPFIGTTLIFPTMGVSVRPEEFKTGPEFTAKVGVFPSLGGFGSGDARFLVYLGLSRGYISAGGGAGLTVFSITPPMAIQPYMYAVGCIGVQGKKGFIDVGVDNVILSSDGGIFPCPTIRAGIKF